MTPHKVGRYEILEVLGRGAMGVVYLARDPLIDRRVALKTLRVDLDADFAEEFRERFLREARAAGRLNHPGVVTVHDVGEDTASGLVFIAMEYVEGRDLKQILASGQRFRPSESARIAAEVAMALDYAHGMGVIHRDVKPANIILTPDGTTKIADFGVARLESSNLTVEGQFIGTPNFMSPEQITGQPVDGRSDLFSLGVVLFTLLTGQRPFAGETMHEVTRRIVDGPCPIPSTIAAELPPAFNPILLKCLEKAPERRFQSGRELAEVLAAVARSLVHREPSDSERTGVFLPDLETRAGVTPAASPPPPEAPPQSDPPPAPPGSARREPHRTPPWRTGLRQLLPAPLLWPVNPRWASTIVVVAALAVGAVGATLALQIDGGPFPAPSLATMRTVSDTDAALRRAGQLAARGQFGEAEAAAMEALDQAPSSPAARRLLATIRPQLERQRLSEENRHQVEELIADGRTLFRRGRFGDAAERFRQALELAPEDEIAASFLELAEERDRDRRRRAEAAARPVPTTVAGGRSPLLPTPLPPPPTPGTARLTVAFNSPINAGSVVVTVDGEIAGEVDFDFTRRGFLGMKRAGSGPVKRVMLVPAGRHRVTVVLTDAERGELGRQVFDRSLPGGSDWTVRVDLPDRNRGPSFFLVRVSG